METKIFDKETILDLMVNFIPLGIILFFIGAFVVFAPWGFDPMASGLMLAIMGGMFIALTVLTYYSAKAIAGDEKRATVYAQGQAGLEGAVPLHGSGDEAEVDDAESVADTAVDDTDADDAGSVEEHDTDAEVDPETDETDLTDTDTTTDSEVTAESETVAADDDTDADSASEPSGKNESTE